MASSRASRTCTAAKSTKRRPSTAWVPLPRPGMMKLTGKGNVAWCIQEEQGGGSSTARARPFASSQTGGDTAEAVVPPQPHERCTCTAQCGQHSTQAKVGGQTKRCTATPFSTYDWNELLLAFWIRIATCQPSTGASRAPIHFPWWCVAFRPTSKTGLDAGGDKSDAALRVSPALSPTSLACRTRAPAPRTCLGSGDRTQKAVCGCLGSGDRTQKAVCTGVKREREVEREWAPNTSSWRGVCPMRGDIVASKSPSGITHW
jgi:hypothetical protein